jgi:hypothetical protein
MQPITYLELYEIACYTTLCDIDAVSDFPTNKIPYLWGIINKSGICNFAER